MTAGRVLAGSIGTALLMFALLATAARAQGEGSEKNGSEKAARAHFKRAEAAFNLGKFDQALASYEAAYEAKPLPALLFNIAQCHRNLGNHDRALFFYRRYLALDPESPNRVMVEQLIGEEEKRAASAPALAPPPVNRPPPAPPRALSPPPLTPDPTDPAISAARPALVMRAAPPPAVEATPLHRRWWVWATVGGLVLGGVVTAFLVSRPGAPVRPTGDLGAIDWH